MRTFKLLTLAILFSAGFIIMSAAKADKEAKKLQAAAAVLSDFKKMKEQIPHNLIAEYQGLVIIPKLINAGLVVGGKRGKGIAIVKLTNGQWSDPVFVTLTGGSIGLQAGVQSVDLVLVFRNQGMLTKVKNGDFTIGGDISAAAGPAGRSTSANTDYKLEAEVYSYSRSRGLFAGISINGANLSIDKKANSAFYGPALNSAELFETAKNNAPAVKSLKASIAVL